MLGGSLRDMLPMLVLGVTQLRPFFVKRGTVRNDLAGVCGSVRFKLATFSDKLRA
jgi:hypothetical protein